MSKLKLRVTCLLLSSIGYLAYGDSIEWNGDIGVPDSLSSSIEWNGNVDVPDSLSELPQDKDINYLSSQNQNSSYISNVMYTQSLFNQFVSGGGTQMSPSDGSASGFWDKLFTGGTYNLYGGAMGTLGSNTNGVSLANGTSNNTFAYGLNGFAQTGKAGGFSVGGAATVMNPLFASQINGNSDSYLTPTNRQIALTEGFVEYQYTNIVGVDVGYIGINNSPWLAPSFNPSTISTQMTYQGLLTNVYAGDGWLLTGLFINGSQPVGQVGFTGETLLSPKYGQSMVSSNQSSQYTMGLGSDYKAFGNNYDLSLWAYQFENFGTLFYANNSLTLPLNNSVKLNFAIQGGIDNSLGMNTAYSNTFGEINSYFTGAQAGISIDWFNLTFSGDTVWGTPIVSPYTSALGTDPLYATGLITNIVNLGLTGSVYQVSPTFSFLNGGLTLSANYLTLANTSAIWSGTQEVYASMNYFIPEVKGLQVNTSLGYQWVPSINPESNQWTWQFITSYLW